MNQNQQTPQKPILKQNKLKIEEIRNLTLDELIALNQGSFELYIKDFLREISSAIDDIQIENITNHVRKLEYILKNTKNILTNDTKTKLLKICLKLSPYNSLKYHFDTIWSAVENKCESGTMINWFYPVIKDSKLTIEDSSYFIWRIFNSVFYNENIKQDQVKTIIKNLNFLEDKFEKDIVLLSYIWGFLIRKFNLFLIEMCNEKNIDSLNDSGQLKKDIIIIFRFLIAMENRNKNFHTIIDLETSLHTLFSGYEVPPRINLILAESYVKSIDKASSYIKIYYKNRAREILDMITKLDFIIQQSPSSIIYITQTAADLYNILENGDGGGAVMRGTPPLVLN